MPDTELTAGIKKFMVGKPFVPTERIAATALAIITGRDPETSGRPWALAEDGYIYCIQHKEVQQGAFEELKEAIPQPAKTKL